MNKYKKLPYPKLFKMWDEVRYPLEDKHFIEEAVKEASEISQFSPQKWAVKARPLAQRYFGEVNSPQCVYKMQPYHIIAVGLAVGTFIKAWRVENIFFMELDTTQYIMVNHVRVSVRLLVEYDITDPKLVKTYKILKIGTYYLYLGKSLAFTMLLPDNKDVYARLLIFMDSYKEIMSKVLSVIAVGGKTKKTLRGLTYYNEYFFFFKERGAAQISLLSTCNDKYTAFLWLYNAVKIIDISRDLTKFGVNSADIKRHATIRKIFLQIIGKKLAF